jgi:hypothetical protein
MLTLKKSLIKESLMKNDRTYYVINSNLIKKRNTKARASEGSLLKQEPLRTNGTHGPLSRVTESVSQVGWTVEAFHLMNVFTQCQSSHARTIWFHLEHICFKTQQILPQNYKFLCDSM